MRPALGCVVLVHLLAGHAADNSTGFDRRCCPLLGRGRSVSSVRRSLRGKLPGQDPDHATSRVSRVGVESGTSDRVAMVLIAISFAVLSVFAIDGSGSAARIVDVVVV